MRTYTILFLLMMPMASAIQIQQVYYDAYTESGSEFIQLYNPTNVSVDLTDWVVSTPTSMQDATLTGEVAAQAHYILADTNWDSNKDNASWPNVDHQEAITLPNTNGFVQLKDVGGNIIDTVGYGSVNVSTGTPHPGVDEGKALYRVSSTGSDEVDFISANPVFVLPEPEGEEQTNITVEIENAPPVIMDIALEDDSDAPGIQIIPVPGGNRVVLFTVLVADNNTLAGSTLTVNNHVIDINSNQTELNITGSVNVTVNTSIITFTLDDGIASTTTNRTIELLPVIGITIPSSLHLDMNPGETRNETIEVQNTGTTNISLQIKGTQPTGIDGIFGSISYVLGGSSYTLQNLFVAHAVELTPSESIAVDFQMQAGFVPAGSYVGQVIVAGVAS